MHHFTFQVFLSNERRRRGQRKKKLSNQTPSYKSPNASPFILVQIKKTLKLLSAISLFPKSIGMFISANQLTGHHSRLFTIIQFCLVRSITSECSSVPPKKNNFNVVIFYALKSLRFQNFNFYLLIISFNSNTHTKIPNLLYSFGPFS